MRNSQFDTVLLDADETIFDFLLSERTALLRTCEDFGVVASNDDAVIYSQINLSLWKELEKGTITRDKLRTERFNIWFKHLGVGVSVESEEFDKAYAEHLGKSCFLIDGAEAFLQKLSQLCDVYIVTNGLIKSQYGRLSKSPIKEYIRKMYVSEEIGFAKPDAGFFDYVFNDLCINDRSRTIIFGDSLTSDMQGGRNAGITTCHFVRGTDYTFSPLCDYEVSSYDEFLSIITGKLH